MSEYLWKKLEENAEACSHPEVVKRVLILYTGGTIGMKWDPKNGYQPASNYLEEKIKTFPTLCDQLYTIDDKHQRELEEFSPIPLPLTFKGFRILYSILEYQPLLDSSNFSMKDWATIAKSVDSYYTKFNGFVILHGTDTMAYTASALSFMFENLGKTVILTGSQVPISELRNDAHDNILDSLILAGQYVIPEVCIFFHGKLYRGNRTMKMNSSSFEAFSSPNLPPLASLGIDISIEWDAIHRPVDTEKFKVHLNMNCNVGILRIFPGITQDTILSFLHPPMEGVVLQTYGAGNVPDTEKNSYLFQVLKDACDRGVVIVNCTQCATGVVTELYAGGIKLRRAGVVPGVDMTPEAALTKLSYLLSNNFTKEKIKALVPQNLRGELTQLDSSHMRFSLKDSELLLAVARVLCVSSSKEVKMLRQTLFPPLMCAAASKGDVSSLASLKQQGGDFNNPDYDGRTPLHLASSEGHIETVEYLLKHGASVHVTDRFDCTPLDNALRFKRDNVAELLEKTGAQPNQQLEK